MFCLLVLLFVVALAIVDFCIPDKLRHIPTIGPSGRIFSYFGAIRYIFHSRQIVREGYRKYKGGVFKIPEFGYGWHIMVTSPQHIEELRLREDVLSNDEANKFIVQSNFTMPGMFEDPLHIPIIKSRLIRDFDIDTIFPELQDEIALAFSDLMPNEHKWKTAHAVDVVQNALCRVNNRVFVGLPLCRNKELLKLNVDRARNVLKVAVTLKFLPYFLKPFGASFFNCMENGVVQGSALLGPLIDERKKYLRTGEENRTEKPNDFLQWLLDRLGDNVPTEELVSRILLLNFASLHSSSSGFTHALYDLAAYPEFVNELRHEAENVLGRDAHWSKATIQKLYKLDSFLRESHRMHNQITVSMMRIASRDFTFRCDGTFIPKGSIVSVASDPIHHDEEFYDEPHVFKPWRFLQSEESFDSRPKNLSTTGLEFLVFGHGRHACPGRFFATTVIKTMMAYLIMHYDVRFEEGVRPEDTWINGINFPNKNIQFQYRMRNRGLREVV
ncbi:cytochrome P450 [Abortiporus biennis]|nr:cytochrome P450 [Abortiporus biennis]